MNIVKGIAQREYDDKLVSVIKSRLQILQQLELSYASHELENCFENVCKARKKLITPVLKQWKRRYAGFWKKSTSLENLMKTTIQNLLQ